MVRTRFARRGDFPSRRRAEGSVRFDPAGRVDELSLVRFRASGLKTTGNALTLTHDGGVVYLDGLGNPTLEIEGLVNTTCAAFDQFGKKAYLRFTALPSETVLLERSFQVQSYPFTEILTSLPVGMTGLRMDARDACGNVASDTVGYPVYAGPIVPPVTAPRIIAVSVRRMFPAYTGACCRIRRGSDNAETDIGFVNDWCDSSAIQTFCAGSRGYLVKWYGQDPQSHTFQQADAAAQPYATNISGVPILNGSRQAFEGDVARTRWLQAITSIAATYTKVLSSSVVRAATSSTSDSVWMGCPSAGDRLAHAFEYTTGKNLFEFGHGGGMLRTVYPPSRWVPLTRYVVGMQAQAEAWSLPASGWGAFLNGGSIPATYGNMDAGPINAFWRLFRGEGIAQDIQIQEVYMCPNPIVAGWTLTHFLSFMLSQKLAFGI